VFDLPTDYFGQGEGRSPLKGIHDSKEDQMFKRRVFSCCLALTFVLVAMAGTLQAAPLKTNLFGLDGLFLATSGTTIEAGTFAVGGSMLTISDDNADGTSLPVTVTFGATDDIEIAAAFEAYKSYDDGNTDDTGTGDLFLSAKFAVQEENADYPGTALGIRLKLPMADTPLGSEETDFTLFAAMDMKMKSVKGILNVEYLMPGGDAENQVNYVVGLGIPYSDTTEFSLELLDQPWAGLVPIGDIFAAGATFDMGSSLNFGLAVGFGLNDPSADFLAHGKLTFML
jgi:hypothetical protein